MQGHGEVQEGDDEFEAYRKRMMLGYKHRPNPLGALQPRGLNFVA
jgi:splicing factor 4